MSLIEKIDGDIKIYISLEAVHKKNGNIQMATMCEGMRHEAESIKAYILSE